MFCPLAGFGHLRPPTLHAIMLGHWAMLRGCYPDGRSVPVGLVMAYSPLHRCMIADCNRKVSFIPDHRPARRTLYGQIAPR